MDRAATSPGSDLAGQGHLWKVTVTGATDASGMATAPWVDVSRNLPDVPGDNLLIASNGSGVSLLRTSSTYVEEGHVSVASSIVSASRCSPFRAMGEQPE